MASKYKIVPLSELFLRSDFMFGQVMRSEEICKLFLEALLGIEIQRMEFLDMQKDFTDSYEYHSIRLDVYLKDEDGTVFNVEIQAEKRDELPKRVRYYFRTERSEVILPCFAVAAVYSGEQNGLNLMYYFRILNSEIILSERDRPGRAAQRRGLCESF